MFRRSGYRFAAKNMRHSKRMFRRTGYRFAAKNTRRSIGAERDRD
jgi:hypothetical protein